MKCYAVLDNRGHSWWMDWEWSKAERQQDRFVRYTRRRIEAEYPPRLFSRREVAEAEVTRLVGRTFGDQPAENVNGLRVVEYELTEVK